MKRPIVLIAAGVGVAALSAGCNSSTKTTPPTSIPAPSSGSASSTHRGSGPVDVLYAGSLVNLMEHQIAPSFKAATGYRVEGFPAGSSALASQIKGGVRQADVFISASPAVDSGLEGSSNGNWVSWYLTFARSPLVLGYNPHSQFAHDIRTVPWYRAVAESGILVGRTDPATDPKGRLTVTALDAASARYALPALESLSKSASEVYPEETLVGRLQAGQLDAGFFYSSEAAAASIPSVPVSVPGIDLRATYTVTIPRGAPDEAGAEAFVAYLLGPAGRSVLRQDGFELVQPAGVSGSGVPNGLRNLVSGR